ncbi:MAG: non-homologous end-joining DNA ligase [Nibricoccus sp.]
MPKQLLVPAEVKLSNLQKVFFPETGFTKGELIKYYIEVAPYILPHLADRPVTLIRYPDGVTGEKFYEKNAPKFTPSWVKTFAVPRHETGVINYILVNDASALAWCANLAAIELHPFLHRVPELDRPTHLVFDLDPGEGSSLLECIEVASELKRTMEKLGLQTFPKVSGSKGLQIYVPLNTPISYDVTGAFAHAVAELLETAHPKLVVSRMPKELRKGKVLIDWSQNSGSKTTVAVYSARGKREEPYVSMPVTWTELQRARRTEKLDTLYFSPDAALKRLKKVGDLFEPVLKLKQKLPAAFLEKTENKDKASLAAYRAKRNFSRTAEPSGSEKPSRAGKRGKSGGLPRFVIQKHAASHLHYDFRLEMEGALKSWAVPKGLSTEVGIKRAAFEVEDHPLAYMQFEGTIPKGQYGGGTVMVWDIGEYELLGGSHSSGNLKLRLKGKKLKGEWHLFRVHSDDEKPMWLIAKSGESLPAVSARRDDMSVLTRRSMARIAEDNDATWQSGRSVAAAKRK